MKKILIFTLVFAMLFSLIACGQTAEAPAAQTADAPAAAETPAAEIPKEVVRVQQTVSAADLQGKVKLLGRTSFTDRGIACLWSGTGVSFTVNCEGDIALDVDGRTKSDSTYQQFRVYLDGTETDRRLSVSSSKTYLILKGLEAGEHEIRIVRDTAVHDEDMYIKGIQMNCDASTIAPSADKALLIDFTGTSITCGSGTLSKYSVKRDNESATRSYAFRTCAALDADWVYSSKGSMGVTREVEENGVSFNLSTLYESAYGYSNPEPKYEWTRHPDIVVMEVGPNDKVSAEEFVTATVAFGQQIRGHHPDCKLVLYHGFGADRYCDYYDEIVEKLGGSAAGVWQCPTVGGKDASDGIHPTVEQHQANADILVKFLQDNVFPTLKK